MKDKIVLAYRIIIVIVASIALYLNFKLLTFRQGILYFTNLSNLLCLVYFFIIVVRTIFGKKSTDSDIHHIIKGTITMAITLTFFMYNFALRNDPTSNVFIGHDLECNLVHIVVPLLVMLDYAIFVEKGHQKDYYPFIWSTVLILYQIFVVIYVTYGGRFIGGLTYPYSYMDIGKHGSVRVAINMIIIYALFMLYGLLIQKLDKMVGERRKRRSS